MCLLYNILKLLYNLENIIYYLKSNIIYGGIYEKKIC